MMPVMDGYETCRHLKASPATRDIPVIFLTAKVEVEDEMRGFELGAVDYITKPISPPVVLARVKTHLRLRKAELDLRELLVKTLGGAIEVLTDILSVANSTAFSRASRLKDSVNSLMAAFNLTDFWQIRMAAMLSQIGCIAVSPEIIEKIFRGQEVSREDRESYNRHPQVGYELIRKIPKLTEVAEIIARQQVLDKETGFQGSEQATRLIRTGSRMLKLALEYEKLTYSGKTPTAAMAILKTAEKEYGPKLLEKFSHIIASEPEPARMGVREVEAKDLAIGMIIAKDIITKNGVVLIKAGTKINVLIFEILHHSNKTDFIEETFQVLIPA